MLYFAYGSNLNHAQMKNRCIGSKYIKKFILRDYKLIFSYRDPKEPYGYGNIVKKNEFNRTNTNIDAFFRRSTLL